MDSENKSVFFDDDEESSEENPSVFNVTATRSEQAARRSRVMNDPRGAVVSIASQALAEPLSGLAGIAGTIAGLWPGGESPSDKGARYVGATRDAITYEPQDALSQDILSGVGKAAEFGTKVVRAPFAGYAGIGKGITSGSLDDAANTTRRVMAEGIGPTAGSAVMDTTGSPLLATAVETAPAAVATALGARNPLRGEKPNISTGPQVDQSGPSVSVGRPHLDSPVDMTPPDVQAALNLSEKIRNKKTKKVAEQVMPDRATLQAAHDLGIDINPEHYSTNPAYMEVARALKSRPGSRLEANERRALDALSDRADEVVVKIGGTLDKGSVSDDILTSVRKTIDDLDTAAEVQYSRIAEMVPATTKVNGGHLREFLDGRIEQLGGDISLLSVAEKKLLSMVRKKGKNGKWVDHNPTYYALDRVRRDVGNGFRKRRGPFVDDDYAILSEVYGALSDVQSGVASAFGAGDIWTVAKGLVEKRKGIEKNAMDVFGRELNNSLVPKIRSSASALKSGDAAKLRNTIDALPAEHRQAFAAQVVGELFSGGGRSGGQLSQGFASTWQSLNRNPSVKAELFQHFDDSVKTRFDNIGRVVSGIVRSNQKPMANPSGSAAGIIKAFDELTAFQKIYDVGKKALAAEGVSTSIGIPGAGTAGVVGAFLSKSRTPIIEQADIMLSSPTFQRAVNKAIEGDFSTANQLIERSPEFKKWSAELNAQDARNLAKIGFFGWLIAEDDNESRQ